MSCACSGNRCQNRSSRFSFEFSFIEKGVVGQHMTYTSRQNAACSSKCSFFSGYIMLWRVLNFD